MEPDDLRARLAALLALAPPGAPPEVGVVARTERDGYVEQRVVLAGAEGDVPAFLLVPDGADRPLPAVVVHHQHHGEWHIGKSEVAGRAGDPLQALGPALARRGLVVLAPDAPGFEDRRASGPGTDPRGEDDRYRYFNEMGHRLVAGRLLMTAVLRDAAAALSALCAHPAVDPNAVGVAGHSMGGTTALFHAALDERVRFAAVSGAACTYRRRIADGTAIELASAIPGIAGVADLDDVAGLVAPRPLLLVSATEDRYSADADAIEHAIAGRFPAGALRHARFDGGHALTPERFATVVDWLAEAAAANARRVRAP
jgi:dienelactone hydrolase